MRGMEKPATYSCELWAYSRYNPRYRYWRAFKRRAFFERLKQKLITAGQVLALPCGIATLLQFVHLFL